jgi:hypothetical protein
MAEQAAGAGAGGDDDDAAAAAEAPAAKRQKTAATLVDAADWAAQHGNGDVTVRVQVPATPATKAEYLFQGQVLSLTMPIMGSVSDLQKMLTAQVHIPANKQKLQATASLHYLAARNSLAHYNLSDGDMLTLTEKVRGGR